MKGASRVMTKSVKNEEKNKCYVCILDCIFCRYGQDEDQEEKDLFQELANTDANIFQF